MKDKIKKAIDVLVAIDMLSEGESEDCPSQDEIRSAIRGLEEVVEKIG